MAEPTEIERFQTKAGHQGWALNAPHVGSSRQFHIVVLTDQALYLATYLTKSGFDQAVARLAESTDILTDIGTQKLGKRRHEIPLDCIDRLEAFPFASEFKLRYTVEQTARHVTLRTPPLDYYRELFDTLRDRTARGAEVIDEPASALRVAIGPLLGLLATMAVGGYLYYMAIEIAAGKEFELGHGKARVVGLLAVGIATLLGPAGVVAGAALIFAAFFVWLVRRVGDRPQRSVVDVRPY